MAQADGSIYINTAIEADGMKAGGKEVEAAARRMAKSVSGIGSSAKLALQKQADSFVRQNQLYAQQEQRVEALKAKLEEMKGQKVATDEFKAIGKQIDSDTAKLRRLEKAQEDFIAAGGKESSSGYKRRQMQIEELRNSIKYAKGEQEELLQSGGAYKPVDTSAIERKLVEEQEKLKESGNRLGTSYQNLKQKVESYGTSAKKLDSIKKNLNKTLRNMISLLKKGATAILGLNKQTKKSNNSFGKTLKTILKYTLGIRSMYILVNKIRTGIKEGFSNLAQYSDETNKNISALMSSLTRLKNSLATAFNPILTVVAPALTSFIDMISRAATYVGMFIAAMTGQKSFVKAIAVQQDYAAGLKDTAEAAEEAEKATDSYLSGLDEVRRFETDKGASKGSDSGYKEPTAADMFETVPIENSIANMVQKIKDLIKNEDWEGLGAYMASGINAGLQKLYDAINWDNVGPKITYFVNAFTRTFNSLVDNIDWDLLGRTIGAGINTVVNTLNLFIEGIDWVNLGKSFATGVMGIVNEVNWKNLGNLLANKFMIAWKIFYGFVTNLDYKALGKALSDFINGAIEKIDLALIFSSLSTFAVGILDMLAIAIKNTNWQEIGKQIADAIRAVDWKGIAAGLFDVGASLIKGLLEAFKELPFPVQTAIVSLGSFLLALNALSFIGTIIKSVNTLGSVISVLASPIGLAIAAISALIAIGILLIANWDKIKDSAKKLWEFVKKQFEEFERWLGSVFSTDWEYWFGMFGGVVGSFMKNFENSARAIKEIFSGIITFVSGVFTGNWEKAWEGIKQIFKGVFDSLVAIAKQPINSIIGLINSLISAFATGLNAVISALNKINVKVPDWVPKFGGKKFGFNIQKVSTPQIPYLATGAVIPPNAPFLALMGEQKNGTNLEAPENLIRKIVREESGRNQQNGGTYQFTAMINRRVLFDEMMTEAQLRMMANGKNPYTALG